MILVNNLLDLRIILLLRLIVHPVGLPAASGAVFLVGVVPLEGLLVGGVRFDVHQDLIIVLLIFQVDQADIHLFHLVTVLLLLLASQPLQVSEVVPWRCWDRVKISHLFSAGHRLLIQERIVVLLYRVAILIQNGDESLACIRQVTDRLSHDTFLLEQ